MAIVETPPEDKQVKETKPSKFKTLTPVFAKAAGKALLVGGATFAVSMVAPVAAFLVPSAFMVAGVLKLGYNTLQERNPKADATVGEALAAGAKKKVDDIKKAGGDVADLGNKAKEEQEQAAAAGKKISLTRAFGRASRKNIGAVAVIVGAGLAIGLKLNGIDFDMDDVADQLDALKPVSNSIVTMDLPPVDPAPQVPIAGLTDIPAPAPEVEPVPVPIVAPVIVPEVEPEVEIQPEVEPETETTTEPEPFTDEDKLAVLKEAGMPVIAGVDLDLQYRMAEVLPQMQDACGKDDKYFTELMARMGSENVNVQGQAFKDYADLSLNCLKDVDGLDNKALAWDVISQAAEISGDTNSQVLDFKGYMQLHGIGMEGVDRAGAVDSLMDSYMNSHGKESTRLLTYIYENKLVDLDKFPELVAMQEQLLQASTVVAPAVEDVPEIVAPISLPIADVPVAEPVPVVAPAPQMTTAAPVFNTVSEDMMPAGSEHMMIRPDGHTELCTANIDMTTSEAITNLISENSTKFSCKF